jgi:CheY-like chemotaxis protein
LLILIADDDLAVRASLCALLEGAGYDTLVASTGKEAIAQLDRHPDVVLTDVNMPDATGLEVIKAVRSTGRDVPIIAMSGWQPLGYSPLGLAQKLGADKVMDKSDMTDLLPALEQLLAGRGR